MKKKKKSDDSGKEKKPITERIDDLEGTLKNILQGFMGKANDSDTRAEMRLSIMLALKETLDSDLDQISFALDKADDGKSLVIVPLNGFTTILLDRLNKK